MVITLLAFEAMSVGTVMPVTARDLNGLSLYAWGFSSTLIASLLTTVLAGGWIDRSGPAKPLMIGLTTFVAGLAIAGTAPSMWIFVFGRSVQGLGTGAAIVAVYVLIARVYPEDLRPRVFAALATAWVLPSLIGPAVGGIVADHAGWRWVFLGLIPLVIPAAAILVPALRKTTSAGHTPAAAAQAGRGRYLAAIGVAAGAGILLYGLDRSGPVLILTAAIGIAGLAYGLIRLFPAGTLRMGRGLPSVVLTRGLLAGAFYGMDVFIPLALTTLHGFSPTEAGVVLTVAALGWSAASQIQGRSRRSRSFFVILGSVLVAIGVVAATITLQLPGWWSAPAWTIGGLGMGLAISSLSVLLLDQSPEEEQGANSSALQISDSIGSSVVVGVAGALVTGFGTGHIQEGLVVAGVLLAAIAGLAVVASFRLENSHGRHP
ncbi:MFS transporter [Actinomadura barringtoniae]|uniref:MFS transporter n=2 Tax=Actinomadura barringtoniae TaxID=1427535 RepID=A0A939T7A3_9ACTN|nr:MFS transporter [Actinomadura barringtoniae]